MGLAWEAIRRQDTPTRPLRRCTSSHSLPRLDVRIMPITRSSLDHYRRFTIMDEVADVSFMVISVRLFVCVCVRVCVLFSLVGPLLLSIRHTFL